MSITSGKVLNDYLKTKEQELAVAKEKEQKNKEQKCIPSLNIASKVYVRPYKEIYPDVKTKVVEPDNKQQTLDRY